MQRTLMTVLLFACLITNGACSPTEREAGFARVAGRYPTSTPDAHYGPATFLNLQKSGKFSYSEFCFSGDVGIEGNRHGTYVVDGAWIHLVHDAQSSRSPCNPIKKIYLIEQDGNPMLFTEADLARVANTLDTQHGEPAIYPLRRDGKRQAITGDPRKWLPEPYASYTKTKTINGKISSVGPSTLHTILAPGMPVNVHATVTLDIGARDGVFAGMRVCSPGGIGRWIKEVRDQQSTVDWFWPQQGGTPVQAGMAVTSACG